MRVDRLITFGDYLCGIEPPMLSYNVATNQYVSIAPDSVQSEEEEEQKVYNTSNVSAQVTKVFAVNGRTAKSMMKQPFPRLWSFSLGE